MVSPSLNMNLNKQMNKIFIILGWLVTFNIVAQTNIKVMSYNLLQYPSGTNSDRKDELRYVLNTYHPDILIAVELEDETGADEVLNYCLGTQDYAMGSFIYNQSGSYFLQQMVYYNKHKFAMTYETAIISQVRDINHYRLQLRNNDPNNPVVLEIYAAHLKASQGAQNENIRNQMAHDFTDDLQNLPASSFVIFAGDFNLYYANEPAYQEIIDPSNAIVMIDPINRPGYWHNNASFSDIHSQATHRYSSNNFVGGGLNDRFDFIMVSQNMTTSPLLHNVSGTYASYGNNGNCYNKSINDNSCAGATYDTTLRNHLYNMSDHLPVVMELESNQNVVGIPQRDNDLQLYIEQGNIVRNNLIINGKYKYLTEFEIVNSIGQIIYTTTNYQLGEIIDVSHLQTGLYFVHLKQGNKSKIIKFVKTN